MRQKAESERAEVHSGDVSEADRPGLRRLRELGLGHLAPGPDDPEEADESVPVAAPPEPPAVSSTDVLDRHFGQGGDSQS